MYSFAVKECDDLLPYRVQICSRGLSTHRPSSSGPCITWKTCGLYKERAMLKLKPPVTDVRQIDFSVLYL